MSSIRKTKTLKALPLIALFSCVGISVGHGDLPEQKPIATRLTPGDAVDDLIDALCNGVERCAADLGTHHGCTAALQGAAGSNLWDDFGVRDSEANTASEVKALIKGGDILVSKADLTGCLGEIAEVCDNNGESFPVGKYTNVENFIVEDGHCPHVFNEK